MTGNAGESLAEAWPKRTPTAGLRTALNRSRTGGLWVSPSPAAPDRLDAGRAMLLGSNLEYTRDTVCCRIYIFDITQERLTAGEIAIRHASRRREELSG
jgi:hypothetical protein